MLYPLSLGVVETQIKGLQQDLKILPHPGSSSSIKMGFGYDRFFSGHEVSSVGSNGSSFNNFYNYFFLHITCT